MGSIYYAEEELAKEESEVKTFADDASWNTDELGASISRDIQDLIVNSIRPANGEEVDKAWRTGSRSGVFSQFNFLSGGKGRKWR